jgi:tRNA A37 threonylcarbamoyladenosine synthetase subunit TsaC/SUA5/YrdC
MDYYFDEGRIISQPSTLIKITDGKIQILRQGVYQTPTSIADSSGGQKEKID